MNSSQLIDELMISNRGQGSRPCELIMRAPSAKFLSCAARGRGGATARLPLRRLRRGTSSCQGHDNLEPSPP
eukprot:4858743-Pleurochrysis_carterae.AAC.2